MQSRVHVDTARDAVAFDRMIFGQFLEHFHRQVYGGVFEPGSPLSDERGFRHDVIAALRELRVPIVRWPGGCFVSAYHWKDGVGRNRPAVFDKAWLVEEPNTFGTDEFVLWCRAIGAEPYICTNAGSGTAEEMSDWVEYCNGTVGKWARLRAENGFTEPHNVKFWSVGNENWGGYEIGAKKAAEWAAFVTESAKMMRRADSSIQLSAAALADADWTLPLLRGAKALLNFVSIHYYWDALQAENKPADYPTCMTRTGQPDDMIAQTEAILKVAGAKWIRIAFDEWNLRGWHHPPLGNAAFVDIAARDKNDINSTYTMADAVFSAGFLNTCLRHAKSVKMACMAPAVNTRGPLYVHPKGIVKRTTFHVLKMYSELLAPNVIDCWCGSDAFEHNDQAVPVVDAVATADDSRKNLVVALINRHPSDEVTCEVEVDGAGLNGIFPAEVLAGDSTDAYNDIDRPDRVAPEKASLKFRAGKVTLRPHSITVCKCSRT